MEMNNLIKKVIRFELYHALLMRVLCFYTHICIDWIVDLIISNLRHKRDMYNTELRFLNQLFKLICGTKNRCIHFLAVITTIETPQSQVMDNRSK